MKDKQFAFNMYIKKTFNTTLIYMFYIFEGNNKDKINRLLEFFINDTHVGTSNGV